MDTQGKVLGSRKNYAGWTARWPAT